MRYSDLTWARVSRLGYARRSAVLCHEARRPVTWWAWSD